MAGYFDTSGLDAHNVYGGTSNNAAADFDRMSGQGFFGGKKNKDEVQQQALQQSVAPTPSHPTPSNPTGSPTPNAKPAMTSAPGLIKSVLGQIASPPQYNKDGAALVPGTPFTPQEFAQQLVQNTVQHMNALAPPPEAMQDFPGAAGSPAAAPYQGVPKFGATTDGPPPRQQQSPFGNRTFGGNTFGGRQFGGNRFGASAQPPAPQGQTPAGPMSPMPSNPTQRLLALASRQLPPGQMTPMPEVPHVGHFRGGSIKLARGGYPDLVGIDEPEGLPMREPFATGGDSNGVPSDGQGDGRSDHVQALLSPGEFVMDAETTALLGNGDSDAGARGMEAIRQTIRKEKGKKLAQGKFSPNARKPGYYAKVAMKGAK